MLDNFGPMPRLKLYTRLQHYLIALTSPLFLRGDKYLEQLKQIISEKLSVTYVIPVSMARTGIYLALKNTIKSGQEVILSPYTIADVVNMVSCAGGTPVFADIDSKTCNISLEKIREKFTANTGAVLITHFYGKSCEANKIVDLCNQYSIPVIEDCAQAFGAKLDGKSVGTFGKAGVFSFGVYKNINAFYGGMIVTDDKELYARITKDLDEWPEISLLNYLKKVINALQVDIVTNPLLFKLIFFRFFRWAYLNKVDAINNKLRIDISPKLYSKMPKEYATKFSGMQAKIIIPQIEGVDEVTKIRIRAAKLWTDGLSDLDELVIPDYSEDFSHIYWYFPLQYKNRGQLVAYAMQHGRDITESYHRNCSNVPAFRIFKGNTPNAEFTANSLIYLPTYPSYGENEIRKTIKVIRSYFGR